MKKDKIVKLLKSAGEEPAPSVSPDFAAKVMRQIRRDTRPQPISLFDQLSELFPRLALGAALAIALGIALDLAADNFGSGDLSENVAQVSSQWLLP
jgi:hypothetical protein